MVTNEQRFKDLIKEGKHNSFILAMAAERLEAQVDVIINTGLPELTKQMEEQGSARIINPELWFNTANSIKGIISLDR